MAGEEGMGKDHPKRESTKKNEKGKRRDLFSWRKE